MKHRTDPGAAPLRPAVRALAVALLMLGALIGGTFPARAEPVPAPPPPSAADPMACPYHATSPSDSQGNPQGCGSEVSVCTPSTIPPIPPVLPVPVGSFVPPWLLDPDGTGPALDTAPSAVPTDLTDLCVSRT
ncbi:hypothetical protein [Yinghuangia sp. YIM S09857]|uniref:hypothetical protein n=1 Tax=Yinghuangia sp. YIM S09857 TaxID=3436929 RepID=UPI003F53722E